MDETFKKNIQWNLELIAVQVGHAEHVKGRARSGYYKTAIVLGSSIVEALSYRVLEKNNTLEMPLEDWECRNSQFLSESFKSTNGSRLSICERAQKNFSLTKFTEFKKVNEVCFKLNLFSKGFFKKIEKIRTLRNKIHLQGLKFIDRSYTKSELEFISSVMNELLNKL